MTNTLLLSALTVSTVMLGLCASARADEPSNMHGDVEIDPTAYAFDGYSLHSGIGYKHLRVDLGVYAMRPPGFFLGNDDFDIAFDGYGTKIQLVLFAQQRGAFIGVDGGVTRVSAHLEGTDLQKRETQIGVGVDAGYRILLPADFYVTPWIGIGYALNSTDIDVADKTFKNNPVTIFPAVHLGYRFR